MSKFIMRFEVQEPGLGLILEVCKGVGVGKGYGYISYLAVM